MLARTEPDFSPRERRVENITCCPICTAGNPSTPPAQPDPPFGLLQCGKCGLIFLSPRPPIEEMKHYYDEFYEGNQERSLRQEKRAQRHFRRLSRHAPKPGRVLEVGAGDGYFLYAARKAGWQTEGLELSQPRIDRAKEWFGVTLKCADLLNAPFPDGSFDAITMFQLIEHVHDPKALLIRANRLLKPGGIMMLSTPNVLAYARKNRDVNSWRIPRHLFFFTPKTLVRTAESLGFEVLRKQLRFFAALEESLGWQPWENGKFSQITRDLWTPFGLHLVARKTAEIK